VAEKPTYKELERTVNEFKQKAAEHKRVEEALYESEERLRMVADFTYDWEYWIDPKGRHVYVSPSCERITGYAVDEFSQEPGLLETITHPDDREIVSRHLHEELESEKVLHLEFQIITRSGQQRWISHYCQPVYRAERFLGRRASNRDITLRKQADEALRESEEKYRNVVERSNDGIVIVQDGVIKYANPSLEKTTGYRGDEAIDTPFTNYIDLDEIEESVDLYRRRLAGEQLQARYERGLRHKDGSRIDTEIDAAVIKYQGQPATLVIIRDITERKRSEEALKKSSEQIKLLAYSVSHDLRSPATGIYGLTKYLHKKYRDALDEKGRRCCESILEASEEIAELVGNINIYISTKEMPLSIETVQLSQLLQMVRDEFSAQLDIRKITWSQPQSMPEINADRLSILRILRNLVENALKHGGDDLSEVTIGYEESDEFHILSVRNDGLPIKLDDPENLFRPFQRERTSEGRAGTGLGLAIVKELAEQHNGMIRVESGREKGVTFHTFISRYL